MTKFTKDGTPPVTKIIRLRNGETLIATMQGFGTEYIFERPMTVISVPTTDKHGKVSKVGVYLKDWIDYTNDTYFTVPKDIVLTTAEPDTKMYADYIEAKIHSDLLKAQDELQQVMQEYIKKAPFPPVESAEEDDKTAEGGYTAEPTNEEEEQQDEGEEDDEDDGLPWWEGNPRIRF